MEKQKKSESGITLIALVITIIVLLILAGVSISLVVGDNGVLKQASNAVIVNRTASAKEEIELAFVTAQADYWVNSEDMKGSVLPTNNGGVYYAEDGTVYYYSKEKGYYTTTINIMNGGVGELTQIDVADTTSAAYKAAKQIYDAAHPEEHMPAGYEYLTGDVNSGYVIQNTTTKDEFVWIPVPKAVSVADKKMGTRNWNLSLNSTGFESDSDVTIETGIQGDKLGTFTVTDVIASNTNIDAESPESSTINAAGG